MGTIIVDEGTQAQLTDEQIIWAVVFTGASSVSGVTVTVYKDGVDVTATVMPVNSPTIAGAQVTLSPLKNLTAEALYRIVVLATVDGQPKRGLILDVIAKDAKTI